jgi:hypothetical protein
MDKPPSPRETESRPWPWSDALAHRLLGDLKKADVDELCGENGPRSQTARRADLATRAVGDPAVRRALARRWRSRERAVVEATVDFFPEEIASNEMLLAQHGVDRILLALLTESEEGGEEATALRESLPAGPFRERAERFWQELFGEEPEGGLEVVIVGGDPREAETIGEVGRRHGMKLRWLPCAKGKGRLATDALTGIHAADAMVVVTGRISHSVMHQAKNVARARGIPCVFTAKATRKQLGDALERLTRGGNGTD